jgi:hypothetical protein
MPNYYYTAGNDTIYATTERDFKWGDVIYAEDGDDIVYLGDGVIFASGRGYDTVIGSGKSQYATWHAVQPVKINLLEGWAEDGFGYIDKLTGINTIHLTGLGGEVIGTPADEYVFVFGGVASLKMGEGYDQVHMYQLNSKDFTIRQTGGVVTIKGNGTQVNLEGVDFFRFEDLVINPIYETTEKMMREYKLHEFTETEFSKGWWYDGVYNEPQLVMSRSQAVLHVDIDKDGDLDVIAPMSRGYRTGIDSRTNFLVFINNNGVLEYSEALTKESPFVAGARRGDVLFLERDQSEVFVTVAHDTAIETESRVDIPWRYGDLTITSLSPYKAITNQLIANTGTYAAQMSGRSTAVDAHAFAVGDINNDGMDDLLIGDSPVFAMLQTKSGPFERSSNAFFSSLTNWVEPTLEGATRALLLDIALGDVNGDGLDDLIVGWGHAKVLSRIFFNDKQKGFNLENSITLPESVYGASNSLHLKTFIVDINNDGYNDILILYARYKPFYGGNYIQILIGDGRGNFTDETKVRIGDPVKSPETFGPTWTDFWQVIDIDNDNDLDIVSHNGNNTPFYYENDGRGFFTHHDILNMGAIPVIWGDYDSDGSIEILSMRVIGNESARTYSFVVSELATLNPSLYSIAYDLKGNAGKVAKTLGAVFGKESVLNKEYVGIGLHYIDSGMSYEELAGLAVKAALGEQATSNQIVSHLYKNLVGVLPDRSDLDYFSSMLDRNEMSVGKLAELAAEHELNAANIDLVGLSTTGIEYIPFG